VVPNPKAIRAFTNEAKFEAWLKANHARETELYLRIYKKDSGEPTVTYAQALDVALCWGWIDGIKKSYDDASFLQRFTPRNGKSRWSQINREHVARLSAAGRMTPAGQRHIDAAKADGRWDAAYASSKTIELAHDLEAAIKAEPRALDTFQGLNRQNRYALAYRIHNIKTPSIRKQRIQEYVQMLKRGETLYPNGRGNKALGGAVDTRTVPKKNGRTKTPAAATRARKAPAKP